jgi:hypothetical protein
MSRNFESKIFEHLDIDRAFAKASKMLKKEAIKPEKFIGEKGYFEDEIKADKIYVEEKEAAFLRGNSPEQTEAIKLATIFEAIIHEHAELSEWFGPDAFTVKTSRFDDIRNGVDSVVEFPENEATPTYLALAIDITFSADTEAKFEKIRKEIEEEKLAEVKYFTSEHTPPRRLQKVPHAVIGAESRTVKELSDLWLEDNKKALAAHPIQFQILEEIMTQFECFAAYAEKVHKPEIAGIFRDELEIVKKIYSQKIGALKDNGDRDEVCFALERQARNL